MERVTGTILALDLGVATGFASGQPGDAPASGAVRLKKPGEPICVAFGNLIAFLVDRFEAHRPVLVVKEKMLALQAFQVIGNSESTVRAHGAYHGIVEGLCAYHGIAWTEQSDSTIRKHFLGVGRTGSRSETKRAVVERCHLLGLMPPDCQDDNRADAIAVFDWASATFGRKSASQSNFRLFEQRGARNG